MTDSLSRSLLPAKSHAADILARIHEEERDRVRRWEEEKPSIERLVQSLTASNDILKAERKKAKARLQELQAKVDRLAQQKVQQTVSQSQDVVDLQATLVALNNRVLDTDNAIKEATMQVASCQRAEEKDIYSTSLVRANEGAAPQAEMLEHLRCCLALLTPNAALWSWCLLPMLLRLPPNQLVCPPHV